MNKNTVHITEYPPHIILDSSIIDDFFVQSMFDRISPASLSSWNGKIAFFLNRSIS